MELAAGCRAVLAAWRPPDEDQERLRTAYLDHLRRHPDGWSRDCVGEHLTASSMIISPERDRVLLTLHRKLGRWLQTGGHIETADPDLGSAALREAAEESGLAELTLGPVLRLSRHEVPCGPVRPAYHLDVQYLITADPAQPPVVSSESTDVQWFSLDRLPAIDRTVRELIAAARRC
ncbi:NUDIX domain-containing protein [Microlunatus elymi]|uniref:NUDIX domain-containing protein n=2 Tax=Microlunatus elymi TaxID=2596828 RepID=A0A516Q5L9_9ACTN|nr:NUDIX domain-containing protein [Microlunatus elymi]